MKRVIIDTNVWLDVVLHRKDYEWSLGAMLACAEEDIKMLVCATSLKDIFYWVSKTQGADQAYAHMEKLFGFAEVAPVDAIVCRLAMQHERPDYEDGIVTACALAEHADAIVTRDASSFQNQPFAKYSPEEFVRALGYEDFDW